MVDCEYLNIDYILAEEEKITAKNSYPCYNLEGLEYGFLTLKAAILQEIEGQNSIEENANNEQRGNSNPGGKKGKNSADG